MITTYIDVDDKWGIIVIYNFDVDDEYDDLSAIMRSFGMNIRNTERSLRILSTYNSGMCISRDDLRMSAIFIGDATNSAQFWSTIAHELHHAATAIIDYYDERYDGEGDAYLHGYLMQMAVERIAVPCFA